MKSQIACILVAAALAPACTASRAAMVGGAGSVVLGGVMMTHNTSCNDCGLGEAVVDGVADGLMHDAGDVLVLAGVAAMFIGLAMSPSHDHATPPKVEHGSPAVAAQTDPVLPVIAIRGEVANRLALEASMAAGAGHCLSAVASANRLATIDAELHGRLLAQHPELARCYAR